jgi:5-hydroxyisourate hydrolase-like protein (transthyretin family)
MWGEAQQGEFKYTVESMGYQNFATSVVSLQMIVGTLRATMLSANTSASNPAINQNFTLSGYLNDNATGAPVSGKQIILLREDPTGAWTRIGTNTTATNGSYSFARSEASAGPYLYQVNSQSDTVYATSYAACHVLVGTLQPTALTITTSNTNPAVNQSFSVSGTLTANGTTLPKEQIVLLSKNSANQWVTLGTATTTANGSYSLTVSISAKGIYLLQATFYGDTSHGASAASVTETVGTL